MSNFCIKGSCPKYLSKVCVERRGGSGSFTGHKIEILRVGGREMYGLPRVRVSNKLIEFVAECKVQGTKILSEILPHA